MPCLWFGARTASIETQKTRNVIVGMTSCGNYQGMMIGSALMEKGKTMSNITEIICGVFVGVLWIIARNIGYKEGFKNGYEQGEKDFKPRKGVANND